MSPKKGASASTKTTSSNDSPVTFTTTTPVPPVPAKGNDSQVKPRRTGPKPAVKYYLVAYNILSALGWSYVLILTLIHLFNLDKSSPSLSTSASETNHALFKLFTSFALPGKKSPPNPPSLFASYPWLRKYLPAAAVPVYARAATAFARVGKVTAVVQTGAVLEVLHVLLGWVRSPLQTTVMQVSSRLFLVWGIADQFTVARTSPVYASMVFAWSFTEVIRYAFYACNLLGFEPYPLLWLRYTTFYVLYPLGAGSEAALIYATLPPLRATVTGKLFGGGKWGLMDYIRGVLFLIWWPGLYVMYTYMMKQRRKVLGPAKGQKLGGGKVKAA